MFLRRSVALLALWSILIGPSVGCLSLSLFNREDAECKKRIDSLESRVSTLESGGAHPVETIVSPLPTPAHP